MTLTNRSMVPALAITLLALVASYATPVHTAELCPRAVAPAALAAGFDTSTMVQAALDRLASTPEARQLVAEARALVHRVEDTWHLLCNGDRHGSPTRH